MQTVLIHYFHSTVIISIKQLCYNFFSFIRYFRTKRKQKFNIFEHVKYQKPNKPNRYFTIFEQPNLKLNDIFKKNTIDVNLHENLV